MINNNSKTGSSNNNNSFFADSNDSDSYFDSFVDPSMLMLPEDVNFASDLAVMDPIPTLPSEIPPPSSSSDDNDGGEKAGSLYEKLTTTPTLTPGSPCLPSSPSLYPFTSSPYTMGSPSSLAMSANLDASWMISNRPRRRKSNYASPGLAHGQFIMSSPSQMALGFNGLNMPYGSPMLPYQGGYMMGMGGPPMSPMNVVVKLPMAPLTPTNLNSSNSSVKVPLVLPCHLQQQSLSQNSAAPNVSKMQSNMDSGLSSGVPSRCSSIAPNSSISSRSSATTSSTHSQNWFTEMSATKDRFLKDVAALDLSHVTVIELKQVLRKYGLNSTGKKVQLVERIREISNYLKVEGKKRAKIETTTNDSASNVSVVSQEISAAV